ncbi:MAG: nucleotidyltransferase family protein [Rhodobacterales bacterium]|nr:nucleotidyltransferase family protein [Rhodobacterales bacterium]
MVLAAGLGKRLRPITDRLPKPLVTVGEQTLIDRTLDRFDEAGVTKVVVNTHHLSHLVEQHLRQRKKPAILLSPEETLLETGGGIAHALPLLGPNPFFAANADVMWLNGYESALLRLARRWDAGEMDALLLLHATVYAFGYTGRGDFLIDPLGRLTRRPESEDCPYLFAGVQILHPRLFKNVPKGPFSLNLLYDRAIEDGRLYGLIHDGEWFHVGTPEGLAEAETYLNIRWPETRRR